jgi:hypothetical protein
VAFGELHPTGAVVPGHGWRSARITWCNRISRVTVTPGQKLRSWVIEPTELPEEPDPGPESLENLPSRRFDAWRRRTAIGGIATGIALGLKEIFQPDNNEPVITAVAPGDPPDAGERLRVILDPDDPTKSRAFPPKDVRDPTRGD